MEKLEEIEKATLKTLVEFEKEMFNTPKETERTKRKYRRRTFHGSTHQTITTKETPLSRTSVNRSCLVRKPLQVVSKASSIISPFSSRIKNAKSKSVPSKAFGKIIVDSVFNAKNPIVFAKTKQHRFPASNLPWEKSYNYEGHSVDTVNLGCSLTSNDSGNSSDDFQRNFKDMEKTIVWQTLGTSRKSKKLDFIVKESKNSRNIGNGKTNQTDALKSTISTKSPSITLGNSVAQSDIDPPVRANIHEDAEHNLNATNEKVSKSNQEELNEDEEFSKSIFSEIPIKRNSKFISKNEDLSSLKRISSICTKQESYTNKKTLVVLPLERKKLIVSRRSVNSSRKALQEARLKGLKNELTKQSTDIIIDDMSLPFSSSSAEEKSPSPTSEREVPLPQNSTPSPNIDNLCKEKLETPSPSFSSSSTNPSESLPKQHKDWMQLFEEPFPRRSPRLNSTGVTANTDSRYEYLMSNFSPLTSGRRRSKGKRRHPRGSQKKNMPMSQDSTKLSTVVLENPGAGKLTVSPLTEMEPSPSILQATTSGQDKQNEEISLKRQHEEKQYKTKKSCLNVMDEDLLPEWEFHFPRPPPVLSCPRGPFSMISDFALPDKDFAKLKLAKIKQSQAKKKTTKNGNGRKVSSNDSSEKHKDGERVMISNNKSMDGNGKEMASEEDNLAIVVSMGDSSRPYHEETGPHNEGAISTISTAGKKKGALCHEEVYDNSLIPATPKMEMQDCISTDDKDKETVSAIPTAERKKGALCHEVECYNSIIPVTPKMEIKNCISTDNNYKEAISANSTKGCKNKAAHNEVEDDEGIIPATPKAMKKECITANNKGDGAVTTKADADTFTTTDTRPTDDTLPEEPFFHSSDSENTLSGSILQNLQVPTLVNTNKTIIRYRLNGSSLTDCFEYKDIVKSSSLSDLTSRHSTRVSTVLEERISPEMLKMPSLFTFSVTNCHSEEEQGVCVQTHVKDVESSHYREENDSMEKCVNAVKNKVKGKENGIKEKQFPHGKEYVPSSQESIVSQTPNELKGLLFLNGSVIKSPPILASSHEKYYQEQQQQIDSNTCLNYVENNNISIESLQGITGLEKESSLHVIGDNKKKDLKHDDDLVSNKQEVFHPGFECSAEIKVGSKESLPLNQDKGNTQDLNRATDDKSIINTAHLLSSKSQSDFEVISTVIQITDDQPVVNMTPELTPSSGDVEMISTDMKIPENNAILNKTSFSHNGIEMSSSFVNQAKHISLENLKSIILPGDMELASPVNQALSSISSNDTAMGSPVNQDASNCSTFEKTSLSLLYKNTQNGFPDNQESLNTECVQKQNSHNHGCHNSVLLGSNTEEFNDSNPSIQGSFPLYSNPEEVHEHNPNVVGSSPFCPDTEELSNHNIPLSPNTDEFCCPESLEPEVGCTATPYGKASVPKGSSVTYVEHRENSITTPVLMQACLQHENSESNEVLSISMWTYDIPGHIIKKRDVIAVCLSHWVVLWIKIPAQEWTILKYWSLDNVQVVSEMFQFVKFLPITSHIVLYVGGTFQASNSRIYGYSETTSYDFQLEYDKNDDSEMMPFHSMCVLNEKEQHGNDPDVNMAFVVAGATAIGPVITKWSLDSHCLDVKTHQEFTLPNAREAITSLCVVDGSSCLLIGSTGTRLLLWNFKSCCLLKEINLTSSGLGNLGCLQASTKMGLLFLTLCPALTTDKERFGSVGSIFLYALNPMNNTFRCLENFPLKELATRCCCVSGQYLALGLQDGMAYLMNISAPRHVVSFPVFQGAAIQTTIFHPNRPIIAFGGGKRGCVHVYSLS